MNKEEELRRRLTKLARRGQGRELFSMLDEETAAAHLEIFDGDEEEACKALCVIFWNRALIHTYLLGNADMALNALQTWKRLSLRSHRKPVNSELTD